MIFNTIDIGVYEDTVVSLPTGWTYLDEDLEHQMRKELFDGTFYSGAPPVEVFVTEGLLLW